MKNTGLAAWPGVLGAHLATEPQRAGLLLLEMELNGQRGRVEALQR